jgi:hypothetical protein
MSELTKKERDWIAELQTVLDKCPSKRLGFFTIGDPDITIYDLNKHKKITELMNKHGNYDFCTAVDELDAGFVGGYINFPSPVASTAG